MHILTKIFVLFAAVLSLLLAALAIPYALNAERLTNALASARTEIAALEAARAQDAAAEDEEIGRLRLEAQAVANRAQSLEEDVIRLERQNAQLLRDRRKAESDRDAIAGQVDQLNETLQTQTTLLASYRNEVSELRDSELRFRREKLDLEDRIADLDSQVEVLDQNNRALQEQLAETRSTLESADASGRISPAVSEFIEPAVLPGPPVVGAVQEIRTDPGTGRTLARVSVGSNDRIRENTKMFLARDGRQFLGNLVIIEVDLNWAVGVVDTLGADIQVRPGDLAMTSLQ